MRKIGNTGRWYTSLTLLLCVTFTLCLLLQLDHHFSQQQVGAQVEARSTSVKKVPGRNLIRRLAKKVTGAFGKVVDRTSRIGDAFTSTAGSAVYKLSRGHLGMPPDPDAKRNVSEIIRSRGFIAEEHDVVTRDGYILTVHRVVNPLIDAASRKLLKPVILQHGLLTSSVDWVINSLNVRPAPAPSSRLRMSKLVNSGSSQPSRDSQEHPNSLSFYLANEGYDVFLANSRGNVYGQRHISMSSWQPKFWSFSFDEQIAYDLPDTIAYVQRLTRYTKKIGYVGHSQGTTMALGLLSDRPEYADVLGPIVLMAPVAYCNHARTPVRHFSHLAPAFRHVNMWLADSNVAVRYLAPIVCGSEVTRNQVCANLVFLAAGFNKQQLDMNRASAYLAHVPSGTSVKNGAHWGQAVEGGRFAHFDHGQSGNLARYNSVDPPDYNLANIRSNSITLISADNDWLAGPEDVARLKAELRVPYQEFNVSELDASWNHIDFLYGRDTGRFVNTRILEIFRKFDGL